ncbi:MAG: sulfatase, partial [Planctomycetota bacterium]
MANPQHEHKLLVNRRHFFGRTATGLGAAALASLLNPAGTLANEQLGGLSHYGARAKRVIYLF